MIAKHQYRRFKSAFRHHMKEAGAWPSYKAVRKSFNESERAYTDPAYTEMIQGGGVPVGYTEGFVSMLLQDPPVGKPDDFSKARAALTSFLAKHGLATPSTRDLSRVLSVVCDESTDVRTPRRPELDGKTPITWGLKGVIEAMSVGIKLDRAKPCKSSDEVRKAVEWLFTDGGRQVAENNQLSREEAIRVSISHVGCDLELFQENAVLWSKAVGPTVMLTRGKKHPTGMSIVLPLTRNAYDAIRTGERSPYQCTPNDLVDESASLMVIGAAERPADLGGGPDNSAPMLMLSMFAQVAWLAGCSRSRAKGPISILSTAGSPKSDERLQRFGFRRVGTPLMGTNMPIVELIVDADKHPIKHKLLKSVLIAFAHMVDLDNAEDRLVA